MRRSLCFPQSFRSWVRTSPAQSNEKISRPRAGREDAAYSDRQDCYTERSDTGVKCRGNFIRKGKCKFNPITGQEGPEGNRSKALHFI